MSATYLGLQWPDKADKVDSTTTTISNVKLQKYFDQEKYWNTTILQPFNSCFGPKWINRYSQRIRDSRLSSGVINSEKMSKGIVDIPGLPLSLRVKMRCFTTFSVAGYVSYKQVSVAYQHRVLPCEIFSNAFFPTPVTCLLVFHFQSVRPVSNVKLKNNWGLFSCIFLFEPVFTEFRASKVDIHGIRLDSPL